MSSTRAVTSAGPAGSYVTVRPALPVRLGRVELVGRVSGGAGVHPRHPRRYPSHAVMLVTGGAGSYRDDVSHVDLLPGMLVVVRPGERHWYGPEFGQVWDETYCAFRGPLFDLAVRQGALGGPGRVFTAREPERLAAYLERVRIAAPPATVATQDAEALELLGVLERTITPEPARPNRTSGWLARSMQLLAGDDSPDLHAVADEVGMPYETWRRRFREHVGVAPAAYRRDARLRSSATLLAMTSLPILEIAHRTGFVDDRHLARHFVRHFGTTPGRYRAATGAGDVPDS